MEMFVEYSYLSVNTGLLFYKLDTSTGNGFHPL